MNKSLKVSEGKLAKALFGVLAIGVLAFIFGPNIYAQFARMDGAAGWGYGSGYGYGYGFGPDLGLVSGYRTTGSNLDQYGYGVGYGYLSAGVGHDVANGYIVPVSGLSTLVQSGLAYANGANGITFADKITMPVSQGVSVVIPAGVTFTAASAADFTALTAVDGVSSAGLPSTVAVAGTIMSFGLPGTDLTVTPGVTIRIAVGASYDGQTLKIYRKDASGTWADTNQTCVGSGGYCEFTTTHLSSFAVVTPVTGGGGGGGGSVGGGSSSNTPVCTSVIYDDYSTGCFAGYQYRNVVSRTPENCNLTAAQLDASRRVCNVPVATSVPTTPAAGTDFVAIEKSLVTKVNTALVKRLAGRILLQVQEKGQAWYVNPVNGLKYYLGTPSDAFAIMRKLALGVSNKTFATFKNGKAPARLAGRILLKVEDKGMAYYVNPIDLKMYYLGRPADAFSVMRKLGLGITNTNLRQIKIGETK